MQNSSFRCIQKDRLNVMTCLIILLLPNIYFYCLLIGTVKKILKYGAMNCPGCGTNTGTYCENCSSEQGITKLISDYFHRGYPYGAIVGLLSAAGVQIICKNFKAPFEIFRLKTRDKLLMSSI